MFSNKNLLKFNANLSIIIILDCVCNFTNLLLNTE